MRTSLLFALFLALACQGEATNELTSLRYTRQGPFMSQKHRLDGAIFWATNHTSDTLIITLSAVEVKVGTKWTIRRYIHQGLMFQPVYPARAAPQARPPVAPHEAGYAYARALVPNLPPGTTWRVRANVQPMLTGLADTVARVEAYPGDLLEQLHGGNTNYPSKPSTFSKRRTYWGKGTEIVSSEVLEE
ncbi:MAG: hypothetical protein NT154_20365 [Verrucomicrobia bacterium]|nr:hypothetical protein [Verrucomicrobiota bacterium]